VKSRSRIRPSGSLVAKLRVGQASTNALLRTHCATVGPPICWKRAPTCARFKFCLDTEIWRPLLSTCTCRNGICRWSTRSRQSAPTGSAHRKTCWPALAATRLRLHRRCGEPLALGRDSKRAHFCCSRRTQCDELAVVPCRRNRIARISLGFLALSELSLHARLVHICLPGDDITLGAYVAARVPAYQRASCVETKN